MIKMNIKKLREYFEELKREFQDFDIQDELFLKIAKDFVIQAEKNSNNYKTNKVATENQIDYLKKLNYKGKTDNLSFKEADVLIKELKKEKATEGY